MLKYFSEVAETGHFGKAAEHLNVTPSPLSSQIKELESIMDVALFTRNSRNVQLTAAGEALQVECEQIFRALDRSISKVQKIGRHQNNTLRIGIVSSAFWAGFGSMLTEFRTIYPNSQVEIIELCPETQKQQLADLKIDIGLCRFADALNIYPLNSLKITEEEFLVAVSDKHPLKERKRIAIDELKDNNFSFMARRNSASAEMIIDACLQAGFIPSIDNEFVEPNTLMAYVASSQTITVVPSSFASHRWKNIRFIALREKLPASLCLIYDHRSISPIAQSFVEMCNDSEKVWD
ncbi:LysR family transcriptional regulator [Photobacterium sanctipauli]|uniref:LysR family transcriptional regulator n=2 Tax=Photobacterium sanctipauli TaxID=1342794 RepID=A0A2T3NPE2_9GAMM|nr:LysR family transcriptional regulator [Photobacterium sanctipauli]